MKLYHGTNDKAALAALNRGLLPRKELGKAHKGNWHHTVTSNPKTVYLSNVYAPYFAMNATSIHEGAKERCAVIEVDTDLMDSRNLVPDEDALEQVTRRTGDNLPKDWDMKRRTIWYRSHLRDFAFDGQWQTSLNALGTCGHLGIIQLHAITRVAFFDVGDNSRWAMACMDPTITVLNYKIMKAKYELLTAVLFNDPYSEEPEDEKNIKAQLETYFSVWDIAKEFDHSKVEIRKRNDHGTTDSP